MKIDWKRKLSSRKFWMALASFVCMLVLYFSEDNNDAQKVTCIIMAGASLIAYTIGESMADCSHAGANGQTKNKASAENDEDILDNPTLYMPSMAAVYQPPQPFQQQENRQTQATQPQQSAGYRAQQQNSGAYRGAQQSAPRK